MTLTLESELEKELKHYPQIVERLPDLLREQIKLEKWREQRFSTVDRKFAQSIIKEAEQSNANREESAGNLKTAAEEINSQLESGDD